MSLALGRGRAPRRLRPPLLLTAAAAVAVPALSASAATPPPYPGLPGGQGFQWGGVAQRGYTISERARTVIPIAANAVTADLNVTSKVERTPTGRITTITSINSTYFVSPPGSARPYGDLPPLPVRTLAFGAVPVEATIHLSQVSDADGLPVPVVLSTADITYSVTGSPNTFDLSDARVETDLALRVSDVRVDGIPIDVGLRCRTAAPVRLTLRGRGYQGFDQAQKGALALDPALLSTYYAAGLGGRLTGNVVIPPFTDCGTDDVAPVLTAAASGPSNPVALQLSGPSCPGPIPLKGIAPGSGADVTACFGADPSTNAVKRAFDALRPEDARTP